MELPIKEGWYWIVLKGYDYAIPCWYVKSDIDDECCFLPGGVGDTSSSGVYDVEIDRIGPEIIEPKF